jgi:hypothetical protein
MLTFMGVRNANAEYLRRGALAALYFFVALWAKREGYGEVDFGQTDPFLDDGVVRHKTQWGMRLVSSARAYRSFYLGLFRVGPDLRKLFAGTALIRDDCGRLRGLVMHGEPGGGDGDAAPGPAPLPGLAGMEVAPLESLLLRAARFLRVPTSRSVAPTH